MSDMVNTFLMSKRISAKFLAEVGSEGRTLTVFFPNDSVQNSFIASVRKSAHNTNLLVTAGFDQATFVSLDSDAIKYVEHTATSKGFDWTDL